MKYTELELCKKSSSNSWIPLGLTKYAIEETNDTIYLFFEMTQGLTGWELNFTFPAIPYEGQSTVWLAHAGFVFIWKSIRDTIIKIVLDKMGTTKNLIISGFSQGAAIGALAHEDFVYTFGSDSRVESYLFAIPRVFWMPPNIIKDRLKKAHSYRAHGDFFTMLPFSWLGYKHIGSMNWVGPCSIPNPFNHKPSYYEKYLNIIL